MPKITEKEVEHAWVAFNKNKSNLDIKRLDSFLKKHGCDREAWQNSEVGKKWIESCNRFQDDSPKLLDEEPIKFWLIDLIPSFYLTPKERGLLSFRLTTSIAFVNKKALKALLKLKKLLDEKHKWIEPYVKTNKLNRDLDCRQDRRRTTDKPHRSHLRHIKERLENVLSILDKMGFNPKEQEDFIYDLFCEFEFEDYGKGGEDYIQVDGEMSDAEAKQRENIKKIRQASRQPRHYKFIFFEKFI